MSTTQSEAPYTNRELSPEDTLPYYDRVPGTSVYIARGVNAIYAYIKTGDKYIRIYPWCPKVLDRYTIPDAPPEKRKCYVIEVNGQVEECTNEELLDGTIWSKFDCDLGTAGKSNVSMLANVVKYVGSETCKSSRGFATVGWHEIPVDDSGKKRIVYILDDGRGLYGEQYYVLKTTKELRRIGKDRMPDLPLPRISLEESERMWYFLSSASPEGQQIIDASAAFRSYLDNIVPSRTSLFLHSKPSNSREASRLGKTTVQLGSCNWTWRTHYQDKAHASFTATSTSLEGKVAKQQSGNCVVDDMNITPTMMESNIRDNAAKLEMIARTTYNGSVARDRSKRNLDDAEGREFHLLPRCNGEVSPEVLPSLMRRIISVLIDVGDVRLDMYKAEWEKDVNVERGREWQSGRAYDMLRLGHQAMRNIESLRNEDDRSVRYEIEEFEKYAERQLRVDAGQLSNLCEDMPAIYARPLTAIWAVGRYAFNDEVGRDWYNSYYPMIVEIMKDQVSIMAGPRDSDDIGSIGSLVHLLRDEISQGARGIAGSSYHFVDKTGGRMPEINYNGHDVPAYIWGWSKSEYPNPAREYIANGVIIGYVHTNKYGEQVIYVSSLFVSELIKKANMMVEYKHLRDRSSIYSSFKSEGWLSRTDEKNNKPTIVVDAVSESRMNGGRYLELKLSKYLGDEEPL